MKVFFTSLKNLHILFIFFILFLIFIIFLFPNNFKNSKFLLYIVEALHIFYCLLGVYQDACISIYHKVFSFSFFIAIFLIHP